MCSDKVESPIIVHHKNLSGDPSPKGGREERKKGQRSCYFPLSHPSIHRRTCVLDNGITPLVTRSACHASFGMCPNGQPPSSTCSPLSSNRAGYQSTPLVST